MTRGWPRSTRRRAPGWSTSPWWRSNLPDDALRRQLVLAWFAFTEDLVGSWTQEPTMSRAELLALLRDVLGRLTAR